AIHARKGEQVRAVVNHRDIHWNLDLDGARLRRGEHKLGAFQRQLGIIASQDRHELSLLSSYFFHTLGFRMFGGRWPSKKAMVLSAAIVAMGVRVSSEADARCGARTTFGRSKP